MTAPRKPVAWMEPGTCNAYSDEDFQRYRHETPEFAKWFPVYTAPDLQPLWALVERLEREAESESRRANKQTAGRDRHIYSAMQRARSEALTDSARELRATMEAMQ